MRLREENGASSGCCINSDEPLPRQTKIIPAFQDGGLVQSQGWEEVFSVAFSSGAARSKLRLGLLRRKGSECGSFERNLRDGRDPLPGIDYFRCPKELAILRVNRVCTPLMIENR